MRSQRLLPALLLLFVGSGCAALIYEVVWFQLLELVIGSSAVSMGVLLGTFMGGMCLGSLLLPRLMRPDAHPLRVYAWLELGIGIVRPARALRHAARRRRLHRLGRHRRRRHPAARRGRRHLPAAADDDDGRDAAGDRAVGRSDPARRRVARVLLRRQHGGRGGRQPARRLLPAARARRRDRDLRRGRAERHGRGDRARSSRGCRRAEGQRPAAPALRDGVGPHGGLRRDRAVGIDRAVARGALDPHAVAPLRSDDLHVLADPGGVPVRHRASAAASAPALARTLDASARRAGLVSSWRSAPRWRGPSYIVTESLPYWPINPSIVTDFLVSVSARSDARACSPCCRARSSGAPAFRWRWPRWRRATRIRRGWSAASMRPTRSAPSSARSASSLLLTIWLGQPASRSSC